MFDLIDQLVDFSQPIQEETLTLVTFQLEDAGSGTRLTVVETGFASLPAGVGSYEENSSGWTYELNELKEFLEKETGRNLLVPGYQISLITILMPIMLIAIANNYGIHLIARYQELAKDPESWTMKGISKQIYIDLKRPIVITGLTTIGGVLGLLTLFFSLFTGRPKLAQLFIPFPFQHTGN